MTNLDDALYALEVHYLGFPQIRLCNSKMYCISVNVQSTKDPSTKGMTIQRMVNAAQYCKF